jgi:hypothetical protein
LIVLCTHSSLDLRLLTARAPPRPQGGAQLLYRASRDGFEAADFWRRCADRGPTLIIVKVGRR